MNFWQFVDRNGFGVAFVIVVSVVVLTLGGLVLAGKLGDGPALCTVPCSEVKPR